MRDITKVAIILIVLAIGIVGLFVWIDYGITFKTIPGSYPVAEMKITLWRGEVDEVFVKVQPGVRVASLVDISYFDGLDGHMSFEAAKKDFGQPQSVKEEPEMGVPVYLYPVPKGKVGFLSITNEGGRENQVWAFPTNKAPDAVILDASLRTQLLPNLPANKRNVRVHLLRDVGYGGVGLSISNNQVNYLILGKRDGETP